MMDYNAGTTNNPFIYFFDNHDEWVCSEGDDQSSRTG